jgi:hypothetical protein
MADEQDPTQKSQRAALVTIAQLKGLPALRASLNRETALKHIATVIERGLEYSSGLWTADEAQREKNDRYLKKHQHEYNARMKSFDKFFPLMGALLNEQKPEEDDEPRDPRVIDVEKLDEMGLSDDQIKHLAGLKEKNGKNE